VPTVLKFWKPQHPGTLRACPGLYHYPDLYYVRLSHCFIQGKCLWVLIEWRFSSDEGNVTPPFHEYWRLSGRRRVFACLLTVPKGAQVSLASSVCLLWQPDRCVVWKISVLMILTHRLQINAGCSCTWISRWFLMISWLLSAFVTLYCSAKCFASCTGVVLTRDLLNVASWKLRIC